MKNISIPFTFASDTGGVATTTELNKVIENQIIDILTTSSSERVMNPRYGANLRSLLFDVLDPLVFSEYRMDAIEELNKYLTVGRVIDLQIKVPEDTFSGLDTDTTLTVSVKYSVPPFGASVVTFNLTNSQTTLYGGA